MGTFEQASIRHATRLYLEALPMMQRELILQMAHDLGKSPTAAIAGIMEHGLQRWWDDYLDRMDGHTDVVFAEKTPISSKHDYSSQPQSGRRLG